MAGNKPGYGSLNRKNKKYPNQPDYSGNATLEIKASDIRPDGTVYIVIGAWEKTSSSGRNWISLSVKIGDEEEDNSWRRKAAPDKGLKQPVAEEKKLNFSSGEIDDEVPW